MKQALRAMIASKKAIAMIAGLLVALGAKIGLDLPVGDVTAILSPILVYIAGQGIADHGKERAKLENASE